MGDDTFTCDQCGGTFDKEWSDEEAHAEAVELWGEVPEDKAVVCGDCFQMLTAWKSPAEFLAEQN